MRNIRLHHITLNWSLYLKQEFPSSLWIRVTSQACCWCMWKREKLTLSNSSLLWKHEMRWDEMPHLIWVFAHSRILKHFPEVGSGCLCSSTTLQSGDLFVFILFIQKRIPFRWYPPEYFKHDFYEFKGDVWAFGIVIWEMQTFGKWGKKCRI